METDNSKRKILYTRLTNDGYDLGDFDSFNDNLNVEKNRKSLYDAITKDGYDVGDYESFASKIGAGGGSDVSAGVKNDKGLLDVPAGLDYNRPSLREMVNPGQFADIRSVASGWTGDRNDAAWVNAQKARNLAESYRQGKFEGFVHEDEDARLDKLYKPKAVKDERDVIDNYKNRFYLTEDGGRLQLEHAQVLDEIENKYLDAFRESEEYKAIADKHYDTEEERDSANKVLSDLFARQYGDIIKEEMEPYDEAVRKEVLNRYGGRIKAEFEELNKRRTSDKVASMKKEIDDIFDAREAERMKDRRRYSGNAMNALMGSRQYVTDSSKQLDRRQDGMLEAARRLLDDSQEIIDEAGKKGSANFVTGVGRGVRDNMDWENFTFGLVDLADNKYVNEVLEKASRNEELLPAEERLLDAAVVNMAAQGYFGSELGRGYNAGKMTAESLPFMLEMIANPVSASGNVVAKNLLKYGMKRFGKEAMKKNVSKVSARLLGDAAAAAGMTATSGVPGVVEGAFDRLNENYEVTGTDENGQPVIEKTGDMGMAEALGRSATTRFSENQSEMIFNAFRGGGKMAKDAITKAMPWMSKLTDSQLAKIAGKVWNQPALKTVRERTQVGGIMEEYAEEVYNNLVNAAIGETTWDEATGVDENIDTFLGLVPMQVAFGAMGLGGLAKESYATRKRLNRFRNGLSAEERVLFDELAKVVDMPNGEGTAKAFIKRTLADKNLTEEQKHNRIFATADMVRERKMRNAEQEREPMSPEEIEAGKVDIYRNYVRAKRKLESVQLPEGLMWNIDGMDAVSIAENFDLNREQLDAVSAYKEAQRPYEEYRQDADRRMQAEKEAAGVRATEVVKRVGNPDTGMVTQAKHKFKDAPVPLFGGKLVFGEDGMLDREQSDNTVYYVDSNGKEQMAQAEDFEGVVSDVSMDDYVSQVVSDAMADFEKREQASLQSPDIPVPERGVTFGKDGVNFVIESRTPDGDLMAYQLDDEGEIDVNGRSEVISPAEYYALKEQELWGESVDVGTSGQVDEEQVDKVSKNAAVNESRPSDGNSKVLESVVVEETPEQKLEKLKATLPKKGKNGEIDYKKMSPQQRYEYTALTESPETAAEDLRGDVEMKRDELAKLEERLAKAAGGDRVEMRDAIRDKRRELEKLEGFYSSVDELTSGQVGEESVDELTRNQLTRGEGVSGRVDEGAVNEGAVGNVGDKQGQSPTLAAASADIAETGVEGAEMPADVSVDSSAEKPAMEAMDFVSDEDYVEWVADNSEDAGEVAGAYRAAKELASHEVTLEPWERELLGRKINTSSFYRFGDRNHVGGAMAKGWLRKDGEELDTLAQELSELGGTEVTEQDIVGFMMEHPSNRVSERSETMKRLGRRFSEIASREMGFPVGSPESNTGKLYIRMKEANQKLDELTKQQRQAVRNAAERDMSNDVERRALQYEEDVTAEEVAAYDEARRQMDEELADAGTGREDGEVLYDGMTAEELDEIYDSLKYESYGTEREKTQSVGIDETGLRAGVGEGEASEDAGVFPEDDSDMRQEDSGGEQQPSGYEGGIEPGVETGDNVLNNGGKLPYLQGKEEITNDDAVSEPVSQGERRAETSQDSRMEEAAAELRTRVEAAARDAQASGRTLSERQHQEIEQRAAESYAKGTGVWIPMSETFAWQPMPSGNENNVYLNTDDGHVYKVNNLMNSKGVLPLFERINLHNRIFPSSKYEFVGFTGFDKGSVYPIFRQEYVNDAAFAAPEEIDSYMQSLGFRKTGEAEYSNGDVVISDLRPRNVLKDADGDMYVVDADFRRINSQGDLDVAEKESQAIREGGLILTFTSKNAAGNTSDSLASADKGNASAGEKQENGTFVAPKIHSGESIFDYAERVAKAKEMDDARRNVNTEPSDAQKEAGNYRKGHVRIDGYDITIENPKGSERKGTDKAGKAWKVTMNNDYGYIRGTEGVDGDHIDVFLSEHPSGGNVYVVDQVKEDGSFDEHKVMYGFGSADEAREAYLSNYSAGWKGLGEITEVSKDEFRKWIRSSRRKTKPFAEYKGVDSGKESVSLEQWKQMGGEARMAEAEKHPLTREEIEHASTDEVLKVNALDYLDGNHGMIQGISYLKVYEDVRYSNRIASADSGATDSTQLDAPAPENERRVDVRDRGQSGKSYARLDRNAGEERVSAEGGSLHADPSDTRGDASGNGNESSEPISVRQPLLQSGNAGSDVHRGSGVRSGEGRDVGGRAGRKSGAASRKDSNRGIQADSSGNEKNDRGLDLDAQLDNELADALKEFDSVLDEFKRAGKEELSMSFVGMNSRQMEVLPRLVSAGAKVGYAYIRKGVHNFAEWAKQMREVFGGKLKDAGLGENEIDTFIKEMWKCKLSMDGETHTVEEWASIIGKAELRKKIGASLEEKRKAQQAAEPIPVKTCDRSNIEATLPFLLPQQQDDVLKAETQFFDESHNDRDHAFGKGYMFTNGTGTGKTYTGLGIVKRFIKQGKGRVLILTPSQKKVTDWIEDASNLGIGLNDLAAVAKLRKDGSTATTVKGEGAVITTYANFRQNKALLEDEFDLIVYDESHRLLENKGGVGTAGSMQHYKISNRNADYAYLRLQGNDSTWNAINEAKSQFDEKRDSFIERMKKETGIQNEFTLGQRAELPPVFNGGWTEEKKARFPELSRLRDEVIRLQAKYDTEVRPMLEERAKESVKRTKVVFLSATPFNTRENLDYAEGYIFSYPKDNHSVQSPRSQFYLEHFGAGYRWRYRRLESTAVNPEAVSRQEVQFSDYLQNELQTMSGRIIDSPYDYSRDFPTVTMDKAEEFNNAMEELAHDEATWHAYYAVMGYYNYSSALFESMKVSQIIPRMKRHMEKGRKVVVFHRRVESKNPIRPPFSLIFEQAQKDLKAEYDAEKREKKKRRIAALRKKHALLLEWESGLDLRMPREQLADAFGKDNVLFFSGKESDKAKNKAVKDFNDDNSGKNVIVIQENSGKEGISLHDTTGKHQRVLVTLALPQSPITALQIEGRIYRIGNKSNAIFEYPLLGLNAEMMLFGQKFNQQVSTTENLALGSKARNLRESFARGVEEHSGDVDLDGQGVGGKEFDAPFVSDKAPFDNAVLDYYTNQKLTGRRDNREGTDYYPTPEPLGYMMTEWGRVGEGESVLEPSAGHGAIARYVSRENPLTAIEPSQSLFGKLQLKAGGNGRKFENMVFEHYNVVNKHDVVLMNPPFGAGGNLAVEHVAKAFQHLDEGGRIVAIIPRGSTDKKFDKWYEGQKDAVLTGEVNLPGITFERAGTSVRCRVVVIDKVTDSNLSAQASANARRIDLSTREYEKMEDFFEDLRDISMPGRTIDKKAKLKKKALSSARELRSMKGVKDVELSENRLRISGRGVWETIEWGDKSDAELREHLSERFKRFSRNQHYYANREDAERESVYEELGNLTCKLAGMTEDEMQRYIGKNTGSDTLYRDNDALDEVNRRFNEELDKFSIEEADKFYFDLGTPSSELISAGVANRPIRLHGSKIAKKMKKHGFSYSELRNLPLSVAHPIAVFDNIGRDGNRSILTELKTNNGNFLVTIDLGRGSEADFDIVSSVFGKNSRGVVNWINKGKMQYVDKVKALNYLHLAAPIAAASNNQELSDATKIVESFENPTLPSEKLREGGTESVRTWLKEMLNEASFAGRERKRMEKKARELAKKLGLENVEIVTDVSQLKGKKAKAKGFFDTKTGNITVVLPNHRSVHDVEQTLLHEAVAHYGLRKLFGSNFDTFLDNVYRNAEADVRARIDRLAKKYKGNLRTATEEYLAGLAEETDFEHVNAGWWYKIKSLFISMLRKIGLEGFDGVTLSDNELRYILWRSYENLAHPGRYRNVFDVATDVAKQVELKVGNYGSPRSPLNSPEGGALVAETSSNIKRERIEKLRNSKPVEITGREIEPSDDLKQYKKNALEYGKKLRGEYTNKDTGITVSLTGGNSRGGIREILQHDYKDVEHLQSIAAIPQIIEDSIFIEELPNDDVERYPGVKSFSYYVCGLKIDNEDYTVKAVVANQNNGERYYDHKLTKIEKGELLSIVPTIQKAGIESNSPLSGIKDKRLLSILQLNDEESDNVLYREDEERAIDNTIAEYEKELATQRFKAREAYQDSMLALKRLQEVVEKHSGKKLKGFENAYDAENHLSSKNTRDAEKYMEGFYKPMTKAIADLMNKGVDYEVLKRYVMAKHGLERNEVFARRDAEKSAQEAYEPMFAEAAKAHEEGRMDDAAYETRKEELEELRDAMMEEEYAKNREKDYSGLSALMESNAGFEEKAEAFVKEFEEAHDVTDLWEKVNAATNETLRKTYESGLMSRETYGKLKGRFKYYVPLRGWKEETAGDVYEYMNAKENKVSPVLKAAGGRTSEADDPFATIGNMAESGIMQGNRNEMKQHFLNMALNHRSNVLTVGKVWYVQDTESGEWRISLPDIEPNDSADRIAEKMEAHERRMKELWRRGEARRKKGGVDVNYRISKQQAREHAVVVRMNGEDYVVYVNGNPRAAQAVNGMTNPDAESNKVAARMSRFNRWMAANFTTRNPAFVLSNLSRDLIMATSAVAVKEDKKYAARFAKNIPTAMRVVARGLAGKPVETEADRYFQEFLDNGGETGYTALHNVDEYKRMIKKELNALTGKTDYLKAVKWSAEQFGKMNRWAEDVARFNAYMTSRQMGRSVTESVRDAKEVTVNFNRKGAGYKGGGLWGTTSGILRNLYLFFNAGIQALDNFSRLGRRNWKGFTALLGGFTSAGFFVPMLNELLMAAEGGDDDYYANLPEWTRRNNLCIYVGGGKFVTIPLPIELRAFYGLGEMAYQATIGRDEYASENVAYAAINQLTELLPINPLGNNGNIVMTVTPDFVKPVVQLMVNKDFTGKPIWKENSYNERMPEWTKAYESTNETLRNLSEWTNEIAGGDKYKRAEHAERVMNWNPAKVEHLLEGYFGGMASIFNQTGKTMAGLTRSLMDGNGMDENVLVRNVPVLNRFLNDASDDRNRFTNINRKYYEYYEVYEAVQRELRGYSNEAARGKEEYLERLGNLYDSDDYRVFQVFKSGKKQIDKIRGLEKHLPESAEDERKEMEKRVAELKRMVVEQIMGK